MFFYDSTGQISTHSLTRRLTVLAKIADMIGTISTHSLTRRLTPHYVGIYVPEAFQLTASQGG